MSISIRLRLTLWYTAAVAVLLGTAALGLIVVHSRISLQRLDVELQRLNATVGTVLQNELHEGLTANGAAQDCLDEAVVQGRHLAILDQSGQVLGQRWTLPSGPVFRSRQPTGTWTVDSPVRYRVVSSAQLPVPDGFVVVVAAPWSELDDDRAAMMRALTLVFPGALVLAALGTWWVAGRAIRPATLMAEQARRITEHSAHARLTVARTDELGQLAAAFNDLVDRLESALDMRRRFLADASHELRTPVSIARTAADVALSRSGRPESEYRDFLTVVSEQMKRLTRMVSDMLTLARTEAADWPLTHQDFYFDELVAEVGRAAQLLGDERQVKVSTACPADLQFRGDEDQLRQMLLNLVENAVRHTPAGGTVRVDAVPHRWELGVVVEDSGSGIPERERDRVFNRYVRVDPPGNGNGMGLGLPIARRIARAHGGDLKLVSTGPNGTTFRINLPMSPASSQRTTRTSEASEPGERPASAEASARPRSSASR